MKCDLCGNEAPRELFRKAGDRYVECTKCDLIYLDPQPSDAQLSAIYGDTYYDAWGLGDAENGTKTLKHRTFDHLLSRAVKASGKRAGRLLDIGCATGYLLEVAKKRGFDPYGVELNAFSAKQAKALFGDEHIHCGELDTAPFAAESFDVIVMSDLLEHVRQPSVLLEKARRLLKPGGALTVMAPNVGGLSHKVLRQNWTDFKTEHLFYFTPATLSRALAQAGFKVADVGAFPKFLTVDYIHRQLTHHRTPVFTEIAQVLHNVLPKRLQKLTFPIFAGSMLATAIR